MEAGVSGKTKGFHIMLTPEERDRFRTVFADSGASRMSHVARDIFMPELNRRYEQIRRKADGRASN